MGYTYASPSRRILKDRLKPMETNGERELQARFCFTKSAVEKLLALLPLKENADCCVSGCIDCMRLPIKSPGGDSAEFYHNRKRYFSRNVLLYDVVTSCRESAHDSTIFDSSRARVMYETGVITRNLVNTGYACRA
ncbi:hypothetical protein HPB52_022831 [Rhipicephalus sanguineus]|uniref:Uncharacterized protein n=1 Tax=Rhipicephalus sanguineus TaxID=34632 RepID=A0A9D4SWX9_RHISA|nr:hypothetical protein HPB52_022831 [Rhipicephalus sanguineus]